MTEMTTDYRASQITDEAASRFEAMTARQLLETMHIHVNYLPLGCTPSCKVYINGAPLKGAAHILSRDVDELHLWDAWHDKGVY